MIWIWISFSNKFVFKESKAYQTLDSPVMVGFFGKIRLDRIGI